MKRLLPLLLLMLMALACAMPVVFNDAARPTATPDRPADRAALYINDQREQALTVTIHELELLDPPANPDLQVLIVLTDGSGATSYLLYPSNQPGVPETTFSLEDYPLRIDTDAPQAGLWVLAYQHQAYPIFEPGEIESITTLLVNGFDEVYAPVMQVYPPIAMIVESHQTQLLEWFGAVDILSEVSLRLDQQNPIDARTFTALDDNLRLTYSFTPGNASSADTTTLTPPITAIDDATVEVTSEAGDDDPFPGYRRVIHEDFEDRRHTVQWFTGQDDTYTVLYTDGAYAIDLLKKDEDKFGIQSWGSIQNLYFKDYIVRAQVRMIQTNFSGNFGGSMGLWLNYRDAGTFLIFAIDTSGNYRVGRAATRITNFQDWTATTALRPISETNEMIVRLEANTYTLTINGEELFTVVDHEIPSGRIAFYCYTEVVPTTCLLEDLEVWIPDDATYPMTELPTE